LDKETNGLAIASFICSIIAWFIFGLPLGILAVVFGAISLSKQAYRGLGIAGLIIGLFDIIIVLIYLSSQ